MDTISNNYFELPNAEELYCSVESFQKLTKIFTLKVYRDSSENLFRIVFKLPIYISCPMTWKGAGFRLGSYQEFQNLNIDDLDEKIFLEYYQFFIAEFDSDHPQINTVKIVTRSASVFEIERPR